jgi:hypothetical protein
MHSDERTTKLNTSAMCNVAKKKTRALLQQPAAAAAAAADDASEMRGDGGELIFGNFGIATPRGGTFSKRNCCCPM